MKVVKSGFYSNLLKMLIGEYRSKLGEKNRTALPKKFRDELGSKCVMTQGYEKCLVIVSVKQWEDLIAKLEDLPFTNSTLRDTSRFLIGSAVEVDLDSQGRFVVPENLIEFGELKDEICFLGLNRWVEMWSKDKWTDRKNYLYENSAEIAEKLGEIK